MAAVRSRGWVAGGIAAAALALFFVIPAGNFGGGSASASYYYYFAGGYGLVLSPADATNVVGSSHTVTATVLNSTKNPVASVIVRFSVGGAVTTSGNCTTNTNGQCTFTYTGPSAPGDDVINAFADLNGNGTVDSGEPAADVSKHWVLPASTPGKATGNGTIGSGNNATTFDFSASGAPKVGGGCTVMAKATKRKIQCSNVSAYVQSGNEATFYGDATDDGVSTTYAIDVVDNGESGVGSDTFSIHTASGFSATGTLTSGNIQVH